MALVILFEQVLRYLLLLDSSQSTAVELLLLRYLLSFVRHFYLHETIEGPFWKIFEPTILKATGLSASIFGNFVVQS